MFLVESTARGGHSSVISSHVSIICDSSHMRLQGKVKQAEVF